eukprot:3711165-Prymnesium_polylepis.1
MLRKPAWTKQAECDAAVRRTAVLQSILCHKDPRPRMPGYENVMPFRCPYCPDHPEITLEFEQAAEAAKLAALTENQQTDARREHSNSHHGVIKLQEMIFFHDVKWRGSSKLHRTTNMVHNNFVATFMEVPFDRAQRVRANEALEDAGALVQFPTKSANGHPD